MFSSLVRLPLVNLSLNGSLKFVQITKTANRHDLNRLPDLFRRSYFNNRRSTGFGTSSRVSNVAPSNQVPNQNGRFSFVLKSTFFTIAVSSTKIKLFIPLNLFNSYQFKFGAGCYSTAVVVNYERKLNASKPESSFFKKSSQFRNEVR